MATPEAIVAHLKRAREQPKRILTKERLQLYAPRCPMIELPEKYYVTEDNPDPHLVHFAIPVNVFDLFNYANKHNLIEYSLRFPNEISPVSALMATKHLSQEVEYELEFGWPYGPTADCSLILGLYSNYTIDDKKLVAEDEEDVIEMVKEALELDKSVRPKWYFDTGDDWRPGDSDDESD